MALTRITQDELDQAYREMSSKYGGRKEDYFSILWLSKKFSLPVEQVLQPPKVALGGNDYGVDAFHFDGEQTKNLFLYQFKWSIDHLLFKDSLKRLIAQGLERMFGNLPSDPAQNPMLAQLRTCLLENQSSREFGFNSSSTETSLMQRIA